MSLRRRLAHIRNAVAATRLAFVPGHYHSPICDPRHIRKWYRSPGDCQEQQSLPGIALHRERQLRRLLAWQDFIRDMRFPKTPDPALRYYYDRKSNRYYSLGDAMCLYCFLRELNPKHFIEIGSGFSSACVLDTIEALSLDLHCTFIDPEPDRLRTLLKPNDSRRCRFLPKMVQDLPLRVFDALDAGDILFIDSSHVLKTCSDVEYAIFSILPRLKSGVFIHFHDFFYPFEYPPEWVIEGNYSWNEIYAVRALLMYSRRFQIEFWNDYLVKTAPQSVAEAAPDMLREPGGSLWLSVGAEPWQDEEKAGTMGQLDCGV